MKKGDIVWADLNPTIGGEMNKIRPVIIVSNNINNQFSETVTILPITSTVNKIYPFEVLLKAEEGNLKNDSEIKANQIRTIDKKKLKQYIGTVKASKLSEIDDAIKIHLALE